MKEDVQMNDVVIIAFGTMKARHMGPKKCAEAVAKSFKMTEDEQTILEKCLIELMLGISKVDGPSHPFDSRTPEEYLNLYGSAVLAGDGTVTLCGEECSAKAAKEAIGHFIVCSMN